MLTVAASFSAQMRRIEGYADLVLAVFELAKLPLTPLRGRQALTTAIGDAHAKARLIMLGDSLALEGAFLSACAMFEETIRDMIEVCADRMAAIKTAYSDLPEKMRKAYLDGCGFILQSLDEDKFAHLTESAIIASLTSCYMTPTPPPPYSLVVEALSSHRNNLRADVLKDTVGKLGITDLWRKLGKETALQTHFSTTNPEDATKFSRTRLDSNMSKRNATIHRGISFVAPTGAEVKECAAFFDSLVKSLANVLDAYVATL